ncbi:DUF6538 domain-containing protein [Rhizobium sp. BK176]|uniref:DUF6538 domain-containing protein n=1 Tax=Rhizobium sp. BK176 TaxID=2587071 RepID=UPI0021682E57|nr:DUF6538 domain-containing protein [Rhizobium sp. BK176]MCS4096109.1 integrase [Rhizobium sp. BK176]
MNAKYLLKREGTYYYRRVFPKSMKHRFATNAYVVSLNTKSLDIALLKRAEQNQIFLGLIEADDNLSSAVEYKKLAAVAERLNFEYRAANLTTTMIDPRTIFGQLRPGIDALSKLVNPSKFEVAAVAGIAKQTLTFQDAFETYKELSKDKWMSLSQRERYKKIRPMEEAVNDFTSFMPGHDVLALAKSDTYRYRDALISRVGKGLLKPETANRKIMQLRKIVQKIFEVNHPDLRNPFDKVRIAENETGRRPPFSEDEIEAIKRLISESDASDQIKAIIMIAMHTGTAPKELVLMEKDDIQLDHPIPHLKIRPNTKRMKVKAGGARHRDIPLLGEALEWMKRFPDGFSRYSRDNGGEAASAAANKLLRRVSDKTFYSFRHRLKDLMRNAEIEDSVQDSIMGHTAAGMGGRCGQGYNLTVKRNALARALNLTIATLEPVES